MIEKYNLDFKIKSNVFNEKILENIKYDLINTLIRNQTILSENDIEIEISNPTEVETKFLKDKVLLASDNRYCGISQDNLTIINLDYDPENNKNIIKYPVSYRSNSKLNFTRLGTSHIVDLNDLSNITKVIKEIFKFEPDCMRVYSLYKIEATDDKVDVDNKMHNVVKLTKITNIKLYSYIFNYIKKNDIELFLHIFDRQALFSYEIMKELCFTDENKKRYIKNVLLASKNNNSYLKNTDVICKTFISVRYIISETDNENDIEDIKNNLNILFKHIVDVNKNDRKGLNMLLELAIRIINSNSILHPFRIIVFNTLGLLSPDLHNLIDELCKTQAEELQEYTKKELNEVFLNNVTTIKLKKNDSWQYPIVNNYFKFLKSFLNTIAPTDTKTLNKLLELSQYVIEKFCIIKELPQVLNSTYFNEAYIEFLKELIPIILKTLNESSNKLTIRSIVNNGLYIYTNSPIEFDLIDIAVKSKKYRNISTEALNLQLNKK